MHSQKNNNNKNKKKACVALMTKAALLTTGTFIMMATGKVACMPSFFCMCDVKK